MIFVRHSSFVIFDVCGTLNTFWLSTSLLPQVIFPLVCLFFIMKLKFNIYSWKKYYKGSIMDIRKLCQEICRIIGKFFIQLITKVKHVNKKYLKKKKKKSSFSVSENMATWTSCSWSVLQFYHQCHISFFFFNAKQMFYLWIILGKQCLRA